MTLIFILFEPTCEGCTVGSCALLSVCSLDLTEMGENNSYLSNDWSQGPGTLPQYSTFIGQYVKNMNYTLKDLCQVNVFLC